MHYAVLILREVNFDLRAKLLSRNCCKKLIIPVVGVSKKLRRLSRMRYHHLLHQAILTARNVCDFNV